MMLREDVAVRSPLKPRMLLWKRGRAKNRIEKQLNRRSAGEMSLLAKAEIAMLTDG
jgi:hypothetical protein